MNYIKKLWNKFQDKKRQEWHEMNAKSVHLSVLNWPDNVSHSKEDEFVESDWTYKEGDRCERFVVWFFKYFTQRCTVKARRPRYIPMNPGDSGVGTAYTDHWVTYYDVLDDDGDMEYCPQADLSW